MKNQIPNEEVITKMRDMLSIAGDMTRLKIMLSLLDESKCCNCSDDHCNCGSCTSRPCMIEKNVSEIVEETGASQSLVSHQLKVLKDGDFVKCNKEGTKIYYSLKDEHVREIIKITYEHVLERAEEND